MIRAVPLIFFVFGLAVNFSSISQAQQWEVGAAFGFGASHDPAISGPAGSAQTGFRTRPAVSVLCTENLYRHFSGEFRYMFRWGGPKLTSNGTETNLDGYTNVITYELLIHMNSRESRFRPFAAVGPGVKIYTAKNPRPANQSFSDVAFLRPVTQAEPVFSAGAGLKYLLTPELQLRLDFRTYMNPAPNDLFQAVGRSVIHGWSYDFVPLVGISYVF